MDGYIDISVSKNNRNYLMDIFKGLFACFVILVHFPFPGVFGTTISTIGICGVIFFFLISGYYAYDKDDDKACKNIKRRFKRNLIITVTVILIYFVLLFLERIVTGQFDDFINNFKNPWLFPRMILLGDFSFINCDAIWFMNNLLISYIVLYLIHKYKVVKYAYYFLPVLLLARIGVEVYVNTYDADWHLTSFFLTSGLPIMLLGHFIASHKNLLNKTNISVLLTLLIMSIAMTYIAVFNRVFTLDIAQIFKILSMTILFIICLKSHLTKEVKFFSRLGKRYSMYIYLFHLLLGVIVSDVIYMEARPDWVYNYLRPILVLIFGVLGSIGICELVILIKKKKQGKTV